MSFYSQLPLPGLKPLECKSEQNDTKSGFASMASSAPKYKFSEESQKKIKQEMSWDKVPKANEAFSMDIYKNVAAPAMANKKVDLFSGLNKTVKVNMIELKKIEEFSIKF